LMGALIIGKKPVGINSAQTGLVQPISAPNLRIILF